ncbi:bifunctional UDP-N-acetylglucosamine diphosphorylase/glucosamine-1-phosphate N-acetyltransferase GlmU [Spongiibacter sp. KMU-158]|uniref:Bifunctional protein GlmU n=1 Tax=Spongiibacter pelagi TaxID=2760804 RepID=A0A927C0Y0_9GAMM|nr:bifunctional UDP-N-acetylglucosamine diphosphorylase/glucosamine-1-phosphate N-acetyltransferase GlmU [Spongiibacter pelagi]MBD2857621.1 bifunctional UDP-N-acetylglucosamine diphosphorylase/glucosamine-1-phosphate N-acetyltransferase GlmU [Spongiibacter pelagi]
MKLDVVILAAGKGTRMNSDLPKVLHRLANKPMLGWVVNAAESLAPENTHVVIGHGAEQVKSLFEGSKLSWVLQEHQRGTGHAVAQALPHIADDAVVLITYGDVPLVKAETLQAMVEQVDNQTMSLLTVNLPNPQGYGRIVRDAENAVIAIVEQKDASDAQREIKEVNTGIMAVSASLLKNCLPKLSSDNAQGEYYLTDIIAMAVEQGVAVKTLQPENLYEVEGVNNKLQLQKLERELQRVQAEKLLEAGVGLADAARLDIRGELKTGRDVFIDVNCVFEGDVVLGDGVHIGPNCVISDSRIAAGAVIKTNSVLENAVVGENCNIGPFARLRPGTVLAADARIGNFVETKNAQIGLGSKVNHLSYIGDAVIGEQANIGAGTITCNYDGVNKFKTEIGDRAFIGSNSSLVAPVVIGKDATVGAGSALTGNVEDGELAVARGRQRNISGWQRPEKKTR